MKYLLLLALFALSTCSPVYAGYSVFVRPQVTPQYITAHGVDGPELRLKPIPAVTYPRTFVRKVCTAYPFNVYSTAEIRRSEVWEDTAGTATSAELFAVCSSIRENKGKEIRLQGGKRLSSIAIPYLPEERETWPVQMKEAEAYLFDPVNTQTPMLSAMAEKRGIPLAELVGKVWDNVILFRQATGSILGDQQRLLDRIDGEPDFATLLTIQW